MLRDYQIDCLNACIKEKEGLSILPTGSGKSHIIATLCDHYSSSDVTVITPRIELVRQNSKKIKTNAKCMTVNKAHRGSITGDVLIIDECHLVRCFDGMYRNVIKNFKSVYGFTATPYRMDCGHLVPNVFKKTIYEIEKEELIKNGYMVYREFKKIPHDCLLNVRNDAYYNAKHMSEDVDKNTRQAVNFFKDKINSQALIFACDIDHCSAIRDILNEGKIIHGKTSKKERELIVEEFKNKEFRYLINCNLLTTGFDYPALENIVILRPTDSYSLYEQICGRGDRPYPNKEKNIIWDFTVASFQFNNKISKVSTNFMNYCIFCLNLTDYRKKICEHCDKKLIKGEPPSKECYRCHEKNYACATYCKHCGEFIKKSVRWLDFSIEHVSYCHPHMIIKKTYFKSKREDYIRFLNLFDDNEEEYRLYYKWDGYYKENKVIEVRNKA
jgi:DNA repair protein RadD